MMTFIVNGKSHQIPSDVNDAITVILQENKQLREERRWASVDLRNAVIKAALEEREACAKVCEGHDSIWASICASDIRARSDK